MDYFRFPLLALEIEIHLSQVTPDSPTASAIIFCFHTSAVMEIVFKQRKKSCICKEGSVKYHFNMTTAPSLRGTVQELKTFVTFKLYSFY